MSNDFVKDFADAGKSMSRPIVDAMGDAAQSFHTRITPSSDLLRTKGGNPRIYPKKKSEPVTVAKIVSKYGWPWHGLYSEETGLIADTHNYSFSPFGAAPTSGECWAYKFPDVSARTTRYEPQGMTWTTYLIQGGGTLLGVDSPDTIVTSVDGVAWVVVFNLDVANLMDGLQPKAAHEISATFYLLNDWVASRAVSEAAWYRIDTKADAKSWATHYRFNASDIPGQGRVLASQGTATVSVSPPQGIVPPAGGYSALVGKKMYISDVSHDGTRLILAFTALGTESRYPRENYVNAFISRKNTVGLFDRGWTEIEITPPTANGAAALSSVVLANNDEVFSEVVVRPEPNRPDTQVSAPVTEHIEKQSLGVYLLGFAYNIDSIATPFVLECVIKNDSNYHYSVNPQTYMVNSLKSSESGIPFDSEVAGSVAAKTQVHQKTYERMTLSFGEARIILAADGMSTIDTDSSSFSTSVVQSDFGVSVTYGNSGSANITKTYRLSVNGVSVPLTTYQLAVSHRADGPSMGRPGTNYVYVLPGTPDDTTDPFMREPTKLHSGVSENSEIVFASNSIVGLAALQLMDGAATNEAGEAITDSSKRLYFARVTNRSFAAVFVDHHINPDGSMASLSKKVLRTISPLGVVVESLASGSTVEAKNEIFASMHPITGEHSLTFGKITCWV